MMTTSLEGIITQVNRGDVISENADGGNVFKKTSVSARPTVVCKEDAADYKSSALPKVPRTENRQKPRLPRLFRTLCCCIRGNAPEKRSQKANVGDTLSNGGANGFSSLITTSEGFMLTDQMASSDLSPGSVTTNRRFEKLLLPLPRPCDLGKKCLIIDLDETLPVKNPDFVIPVEIDNVIHQVYVLKRPFVDEFLQRIGDKFECILFTASLAKYADPVADLLDKRGVFRSRLFREACVFHKGNYVKDLNRLGRDLKRVIIVDNSPASYAFHPDNAIPVQSWFDDVNDVELLDIVPLLEQLADVDNIYSVLRNSNEDVRLCSASPTPPISETIP